MEPARKFDRYIGIDYSGAETPASSLKGLRVYMAYPDSPPVEVLPPLSQRKYWTRRGIAEWLAQQLSSGRPAIVGIDHGFSFPMAYFEANKLPLDWAAFLDDFQRHWPTDENIYVGFVREGICGHGAARCGDSKWRRLTERRCHAKSVFLFDVQGSVAKSTHSGLPWLRYLRLALFGRVHFWPFDGWEMPSGKSVIFEAYPALWSKSFPTDNRNTHQHDAWSIAAWLRQADADASLDRFTEPVLTDRERRIADLEGWILGVM